MKIPHRKPIVKTNDYQLESALERHFPDSKEARFLGFGIGTGWSDIVLDLHKKLGAEKSDYQIFQIKEKFGGLRFYTGPMTEQGYKYITEAEDLSFKTCEECGRPGKVWSDKSWLRTLCWIDYLVSEVNKTLWFIQRKGLTSFFKTYFYVRRLRRNMKRNESAEN